MKVKINQLNEELDEKNSDLRIENLQNENNRLSQLLNRHQVSRNANKNSVSCQTSIDLLKVSNSENAITKYVTR